MTTRAKVDLPEPELADHSQCVAFAHFEADVVDDLGLARIVGADVVDGEDRNWGGGDAIDEGAARDAFAHQAARIFLFRLKQDLL